MGLAVLPLKEYLSIVKELVTPTEYVGHVWDLDLEALKAKGLDTFVLDVDNTILSTHQKKLSLRHLSWVQKCKDMGFKVWILSNNSKFKRIHRVCEQVSCDGYYFACKPLTYSLSYIHDKHQLDYDKTIVVGDQVLTDVIMGKWKKCYTVLVDPIDKKLSFIKRIQREFEKWLHKKLNI